MALRYRVIAVMSTCVLAIAGCASAPSPQDIAAQEAEWNAMPDLLRTTWCQMYEDGGTSVEGAAYAYYTRDQGFDTNAEELWKSWAIVLEQRCGPSANGPDYDAGFEAAKAAELRSLENDYGYRWRGEGPPRAWCEAELKGKAPKDPSAWIAGCMSYTPTKAGL
jgi:hypothetical protein